MLYSDRLQFTEMKPSVQPIFDTAQIGMKWMISKEKLISIGDGCLFSDQMNVSTIPGLRYKLDIYPNGNKAERLSHVKSFLYFNSDYDMSKRIVASYTISIKSTQHKYTVKEYPFDDLTMGVGGQLCTREELFDPSNNCFVDDILTIELEGCVRVTPDLSIFSTLKILPPSKVMNSLWEDKNKDGTILSNGQSIKYHKNILSFASKFFKTKQTYIHMDDFDVDVINLVVEFCYERDITDRITDKNECQLFQFANKYNLIEFKAFMETLMIKKLSEETVVKFANLSLKIDVPKLQDQCVCFLMKSKSGMIFIKDIEILHENFLMEIGRRSLFYTCKS